MHYWGPWHRRGKRSVASGGGTDPILAWLVCWWHGPELQAGPSSGMPESRDHAVRKVGGES